MTILTKNGFEVAPMSAHTARIMWDLSRHGPTRQCENVKTMAGWRAIRHQYRTHSTKALVIAAKAAREGNGMAYILHADDKVTRVMVDFYGKVRTSSAYPHRA